MMNWNRHDTIWMIGLYLRIITLVDETTEPGYF